jgi:hypothetical protein
MLYRAKHMALGMTVTTALVGGVGTIEARPLPAVSPSSQCVSNEYDWSVGTKMAWGAVTEVDTGLFLAAGTYRFVVETSDSYPERVAVVQPHEQILLQVGAVRTGYTADLADNVETASVVTEFADVVVPAGTLVVRHRAAVDEAARTAANSLFVRGVAVSEVCPVTTTTSTTTSTTTPVPSTTAASAPPTTPASSTVPSTVPSTTSGGPQPPSTPSTTGPAPSGPSTTPSGGTPGPSVPETGPGPLPETGSQPPGGAAGMAALLLLAGLAAVLAARRPVRPTSS